MITFSKLGQYGRLGNQMFQIAATVAHSIDVIDIYIINNWKYKDFFEGNFNDGKIVVSKEYYEPTFHYIKLPPLKNIDLRGYYQSDKYFSAHEDKIRELFKPKKEIIDRLNNDYTDILTNSVSMHVRRTDYVSKQNYHPLQPKKYYEKSLKYISDRTQVDNVLVFSDDIQWCKNNMDSSYHYIDNNEIDDMFLMSLCKNNIIANSSFSWWGSWLNTNENKIIIAPNNWFGIGARHNNTRDLYRKEMIKL